MVAVRVRMPVEDWKDGLVVNVGAGVIPARSTANDFENPATSVPSAASRTLDPSGL